MGVVLSFFTWCYFFLVSLWVAGCCSCWMGFVVAVVAVVAGVPFFGGQAIFQRGWVSLLPRLLSFFFFLSFCFFLQI